MRQRGKGGGHTPPFHCRHRPRDRRQPIVGKDGVSPFRARKTCRTRSQARAGVFDDIERFCNPTRHHSTLGYLSPMDFERSTVVA